MVFGRGVFALSIITQMRGNSPIVINDLNNFLRIDNLYKEIWRIQVENGWLKKKLGL